MTTRVDANPLNLYADPEFRKYNPASVWQNAAQPDGYEIPVVLSGNSDMTWETTSWIAANPDASGFLAGQFDPWSMHVNTYYLGLKYPVTVFLPMDPYLPVSSEYAPLYPLSLLASDMARNQPPGTADTKDSGTGNFDALPPEVTGRPRYVVPDRQRRPRAVPAPPPRPCRTPRASSVTNRPTRRWPPRSRT